MSGQRWCPFQPRYRQRQCKNKMFTLVKITRDTFMFNSLCYWKVTITNTLFPVVFPWWCQMHQCHPENTEGAQVTETSVHWPLFAQKIRKHHWDATTNVAKGFSSHNIEALKRVQKRQEMVKPEQNSNISSIPVESGWFATQYTNGCHCSFRLGGYPCRRLLITQTTTLQNVGQEFDLDPVGDQSRFVNFVSQCVYKKNPALSWKLYVLLKKITHSK